MGNQVALAVALFVGSLSKGHKLPRTQWEEEKEEAVRSRQKGVGLLLPRKKVQGVHACWLDLVLKTFFRQRKWLATRNKKIQADDSFIFVVMNIYKAVILKHRNPAGLDPHRIRLRHRMQQLLMTKKKNLKLCGTLASVTAMTKAAARTPPQD